MVDTAGRIEMVNRRAECVVGYPRQELLGRFADVLVPELCRGEDSDLQKRRFLSTSPRSSVAVPCGLVANELVSNALKHAFPNGRSGEITIELTGEAGGNARLSVADTGIGMPRDFDLAVTTTLGLQLVTELATQLGGSLAIEPANPTRFQLTFPTRGTQELEPLRTGIIQ